MRKIVVDGGPCSGKTTGMAYFMEKFSDRGFKVIVVPEVATMVINSGFDPRLFQGPEDGLVMQKLMFDMQLNMERNYEKYAKELFGNQNILLLLDRGVMSQKAYIPDEFSGYFEEMVKRSGKNITEMRDGYDGVVYLVTADKEFYTLENNKARLESHEEAVVADERTRQCWVEHPKLSIINNSCDFSTKIKRAFNATCSMLNVPGFPNQEKKFLLKDFCVRDLPKHQKIEIEQTHILSSNKRDSLLLRKRKQGNACVYFWIRQYRMAGLEYDTREEKVISLDKFCMMLRKKDKKQEIIVKNRYCFFDNDQHFELDVFSKPQECRGTAILKMGVDNGDEIKIPSFIKVKEEIDAEEKK